MSLKLGLSLPKVPGLSNLVNTAKTDAAKAVNAVRTTTSALVDGFESKAQPVVAKSSGPRWSPVAGRTRSTTAS